MNRKQQPQADEVNHSGEDSFEFPVAMFVADENRIFTLPNEDGNESLVTFSTMEVAALALEKGRDGVEDTTTIIKVGPDHWSIIAAMIGPSLTTVMVVFRVNENSQSVHCVPIDVFLEVARRRCEAEPIRLYSQPNEEA